MFACNDNPDPSVSSGGSHWCALLLHVEFQFQDQQISSFLIEALQILYIS